MKQTTVNTGKALRVFGLILSLGALPLLPGVTGCAGYDQSTSERIADDGIASRVRSALSDDTQYKYGGVSVETFKGTVRLSGFVNSRDQKNRAGDLAREASAGKLVVNNITVKESVN